MSDAGQSKRERQKARREVKVAREQQAAAKSRRTRFVALGVVALLVVGAVGALVYQRVQRGAEEDLVAAQATERAAEVGCTDVEELPDLGGGHLAGDPAALAANDPATLYPDRPTTSGRHLPSVALSGVYDERIDERLLLHNLEHGYVNVYYSPDAPQETIDAVKAYGQEQLDAGVGKVIVAPYDEPLPDEAAFSMVAWDFRQSCQEFDETVVQAFMNEYISGEAAPERFIDGHVRAEPGVLDPNAEEGPLLFPPLSDAGEAPGPDEQPSASSEDPAAEPAQGSEAPATGAPATEAVTEDAS